MNISFGAVKQSRLFPVKKARLIKADYVNVGEITFPQYDQPLRYEVHVRVMGKSGPEFKCFCHYPTLEEAESWVRDHLNSVDKNLMLVPL